MGVTANGGSLSLPMQIALSLTLMVLLPAVVMSITPFLRITIVLHFLPAGSQERRSTPIEPGADRTPALFLSILDIILQPVITDVYHKAWEPMDQGKLTAEPSLRRRL